MKKMGRWNLKRDFTLAITAAAPGRTARKRKSLRDCQMKYLQRFNKYTKTRGVTISSSELKPKRTCRQRRAGHMKEKLNNRDWSQERTLWARGQKKNKCSKDSTGDPQKQEGGTGNQKETRRCAVYKTPCAIFQHRSVT